MYDKTLYVWRNKFTPVKKKISQPLVMRVETFRMSAKNLMELRKKVGVHIKDSIVKILV